MTVRNIASRTYAPGVRSIDVDFPQNGSWVQISFGKEVWPTSGPVLSVQFTWPDGEQSTAVLGPGNPSRPSSVKFDVPTIAVNNQAEKRALAAATMQIVVEVFQQVTTSITYEVV
jgi:hypothetical protein